MGSAPLCAFNTECEETTVRRLILVSLICIAVASCDSSLPAAAPSITRVELAESSLVPGAQASLTFFADGKPISSGDVQWESRDPSVATVDRGVVRAVAAGATQLVGRYRSAIDSADVLVHFDALGSGGAALRMSSGTLGAGALLTGVAANSHLQVNDTDTYIGLIAASNGGGGLTRNGFTLVGDTVLEITMPSKITAGTFAVAAPQSIPTVPFFTGMGVRLLIPPGVDGKLSIYVPVRPATLVVTSVTNPRAPGYAAGAVRGHISFEAAGFTYSLTSPVLAPIGNRTVMVFAEFAAPLYEYPVSAAALAISGTPFIGAAALVSPVVLDAQRRLVFKGTGIVRTSVADQSGRTLDVSMTLARAALGTYEANATGGDVSAQVTIAPQTGGAPMLLATQTSGTVTVTSYVPPTDDDFGEVRGTLNLALGFGTQPETSGSSMGLVSTFRLPVAPIKEPPPIKR